MKKKEYINIYTTTIQLQGHVLLWFFVLTKNLKNACTFGAFIFNCPKFLITCPFYLCCTHALPSYCPPKIYPELITILID